MQRSRKQMSKIELIQASALEQNVDAIVNAANKYLMSGGGICGEIFKKAGYEELSKACDNHKVPLNDGDAVITSSFNITNAKYIIHAVGPDFSIKGKAFDELQKAYYNSLVVLKENNLHTISFPLISSGIYGGALSKPALTSATECLNAYNKFINDFPKYEINVKLCAFSSREFKEAKPIFETI